MTALRLLSPAKLNLFLHVTGRRADGYHELQTLFRLLDWGDTVTLTPRDDARIRLCTPLPGVADADHLAVRAAQALASAVGSRRGVDISVDKVMPAGGGIGGGSSNAATVLRGLNQLWDVGLDTDELAAIGLALGADVPVFVRGSSAWADGVGDQLVAVALAETWYLLIHPGVGVATAKVFQDPELTRNSPAMTIPPFLISGASDAALQEFLAATRNDLQPVAQRLAPPVAAALAWLEGHAEARMTGSGACIFAAFSSREAAAAVLAQIPSPWRGWVVRGI